MKAPCSILYLSFLLEAIHNSKAVSIKSKSLLRAYDSKPASKMTLDTCGYSKIVVEDNDRIVGGRDATTEEFPWMASLRFVFPSISPMHMCGATILNDQWVITAAHCVDGWPARFFEIAVGLTKQSEEGPFFSSHRIERFVPHEEFDDQTFNNDIALIKLKTPIVFSRSNSNVNGICLPESDEEVSGVLIATGWGDTTEGGNSSDSLQAVYIPSVARDICEEIFGGKDVITETMFCAGQYQGGVDTCQGDSGGPLIRRNEDGRCILQGIVSWGVGCARPGLPGIYTLVSRFNNWIEAHMKE